MRYMAYLGLSAMLLTASAPPPFQSGGGWPAWERRVEGISQAIHRANRRELGIQCSGMNDTLRNSGVRFPKWAMAVRDACQAMDNVMEGSNNPYRNKAICRDLRRSATLLKKAKAGPDIPRGAPAKARALEHLLMQVREAACFGRLMK